MTSEAEFRAAVLPFTLHYEAGFQVLKGDRGNWTGGAVGRGVLRGTNFGISAASYPALDIRHLTRDTAAAIYWRDYCAKPGFDRLALGPCQVVFDAGVMSGTGRAEAWRRQSAALPAATQIRAVSAARLRLCRGNPREWAQFGRGWSARIAACEVRALKMMTPVVPQLPPASPPHPAAQPAPKGSAPMRMLSTLTAAAAALVGFSAAAHAADIAVAPYANAFIEDVLKPVFGVVVTFVVALVGNEARHYLGNQAGGALADNVDKALNWAIAAGAKEAEKRITEEGFVFKVDGIVADLAVGYAQKNFPGLMKKAGGDLADRIQARLPSHPDLLELKALVTSGTHPALAKAA